ncbi:MAG: hypothetical protein IJ168_05035 [Eubacterium sp.]|nr:hypothetical protein [Eubacterium sp.]
MKKTLSVFLALMMAISCFAGFGMEAFAANGWQKETGSYEDEGVTYTYTYWVYYKNGECVTGWQKINGKWYFFYGDGENLRDSDYWDEKDNHYYFDANGVMRTGWYNDKGTSEYYDEEEDEWVPFSYNDWYYLDPSSGKAVKGWKKINNKWYYFDVYDGAMVSDIALPIGDDVYCFDKSGAMVAGGWFKETYAWDDEDGTHNSYDYWYYTTSSGKCLTGWQKISGKWYYFDKEYATMYANGGYQIGNATYCFNKSGAMVTSGWYNEKESWTNEDGTIGSYSFWYYISASNNKALTGWQKISGKWYYFEKEYATMVTGWQKIGGKWYYFNGSGAMQTGWKKLGGKWYYFNASGAMVTGWLKLSGSWYYFNNSGAMLANTSQKIGSKTYKFNASGVCTNP